MIESKTLGHAAGIQYQGVIDQSESTSLPSLNNGVIMGRFKRGRMDKPFTVTPASYKSLLGHDPANKSYLAVEDAFKRGVTGINVLRVGSTDANKPAINTGTVIFSVESYDNPSNEYQLYVYIDEPVGDWSLKESGVVIADSTGFIAENVELEFNEAFADIYFNVITPNTKHFELDVTAGYVDLSYYGDDSDYDDSPLGEVIISQFSSKIPSFSTGLNNTLLTVPETLPPELVDISYLFYEASLFNQNISMWNVSHILNMNGMFYGNTLYNQDLSPWCVANLPFGAESFSEGAVSWTLPKPNWGTCPRGEGGVTDYAPDAVLPSQQPSASNSYIRLTPVTPIDALNANNPMIIGSDA
ncbi:BspA family leucine-rich repeat surface protein [Psychrobacter sp. W2-37-MNA-CIBAN-0211]|uniref:BspA family leucine-rich repeat surface protein n=1 Tax=Psychrobacter sp. W2-37-MNA-CIBAN-0211 TaxID=3140443 RepID=UPI003320CF6D